MYARLLMFTGFLVVASVEADEPEPRCRPLIFNDRNLACFEVEQYSGLKHCSEPMPVDTVAMSVCKPGYSRGLHHRVTRQIPDFRDLGFFLERISFSKCTLSDKHDGAEWTQETHPPCKPVCGVSKIEYSEMSPLIIDGRPAPVGFFPWHAGLYFRNVTKDGMVEWIQKCGGTLITNRVVLTAAHCVSGKSKSEVRVALGKYYRSWDHQEPTEEKRNCEKLMNDQISELAIHRFFHEQAGFTFDIALVLLSQEVTFSENIMPACRDYDERIARRNKTSAQLHVVGWGRISSAMSAPSSETLLHNTVTAKSEEECRNFNPRGVASFDKFCASNNNAESTVQPGDSGGGATAVYEDGLHYIVGIVSAKSKSSGREMGYFTNVTWKYHFDWIEDQLKKWG